MTTANGSLRRGAPQAGALAPAGRTRARRWTGIAIVLVVLLVLWEIAKWLGGDPWRLHGTVAGIRIDYEHIPPLDWRIANDLSLPHVWDIARAFIDPAQRGGAPLGVVLTGQAVFTFGEALAGFALGALLGLVLGIMFVHSRLAERAFVPYVVASQTVPILAIAPLVVVALKADWLSVMAVAMYLTFFPVTIASMRGLRAFDPRSLELFRSYAATRRQILWQLRLPTSIPYLFSGFRIAAAASVIGAIIGEQTAGVASGLGSAIINYNQYYTSGPERLWATVVMCSLVGFVFVGAVNLAERLVTRGRYRSVGDLV